MNVNNIYFGVQCFQCFLRFFLTSTKYFAIQTSNCEHIYVINVTELMLDPWADISFVKIVLCDIYVSVISVCVSKEKSFEHIAARRNNVIWQHCSCDGKTQLLGTGGINELECQSRDGRELCLTGGPMWGRYTLVKTQM